MIIMNILWLKAALVRAIKTMAQTAVALIGTNTVGILDVNWTGVLSASLLAGIISLLTSVAGLPEVEATNVLNSPILNEGEEDWESKGGEEDGSDVD